MRSGGEKSNGRGVGKLKDTKRDNFGSQGGRSCKEVDEKGSGRREKVEGGGGKSSGHWRKKTYRGGGEPITCGEKKTAQQKREGGEGI